MDLLFVGLDMFTIASMLVLGIVGARYTLAALRLEELRPLRRLWEPSIVSGSFLFLIVIGQLAGHYTGMFSDSLFFQSMAAFVYLGSLFYLVTVFRFTRTVKSYTEALKRAKAQLLTRTQKQNDFEKINELIKEKSPSR